MIAFRWGVHLNGSRADATRLCVREPRPGGVAVIVFRATHQEGRLLGELYRTVFVWFAALRRVPRKRIEPFLDNQAHARGEIVRPLNPISARRDVQ